MILHSEDTIFIVINDNKKISPTNNMVVRISKEFIDSIFTQVSCTCISFCNTMQTVTMELQQMYI